MPAVYLGADDLGLLVVEGEAAPVAHRLGLGLGEILGAPPPPLGVPGGDAEGETACDEAEGGASDAEKRSSDGAGERADDGTEEGGQVGGKFFLGHLIYCGTCQQPGVNRLCPFQGRILTSMADREIDVAAGSVIGVRSWKVYNGKLVGAFNFTWTPGRPVYQARCLAAGLTPLWYPVTGWLKRDHPVPVLGCMCGFWAYWNRAYVPYHAISDFPVTGVVEGFGKAVIGSLGFRAERVRIKALAPEPANQELVMQLAGRYRVPSYFSIQEMLSEHPLTQDYVKI